jgi:hypothetical protein
MLFGLGHFLLLWRTWTGPPLRGHEPRGSDLRPPPFA